MKHYCAKPLVQLSKHMHIHALHCCYMYMYKFTNNHLKVMAIIIHHAQYRVALHNIM